MPNQIIQFPEHTLLSEPDFDVSYQVYCVDGRAIPLLHLEIFYWSPSVYRRLKALWPEVRAKLPPIILCQPRTDGPLFEKFTHRFGWELIGDCMCTDGQNRRLFRHIRTD